MVGIHREENLFLSYGIVFPLIFEKESFAYGQRYPLVI